MAGVLSDLSRLEKHLEIIGINVDQNVKLILRYFDEYDISIRESTFGSDQYGNISQIIEKKTDIPRDKIKDILIALEISNVLKREKRLSAPFSDAYSYGFSKFARNIYLVN